MKAITADLLARAVGCGHGMAATIAAPLREATAAYEIDGTPRRFGCFLAQVGHESMGFTRLSEALNYRQERLHEVCLAAKPGSRWRSLLPRVAELANNPTGLANAAYGGRMGNGPESSGDGYRYRGRGWMQITGKANYEVIRDILRKRFQDAPDFVANPDALLDVRWAALAAAAFWDYHGLNELADGQQFERVTKLINGDKNGMKDRQDRYKRAMAALTA
ncbi:hypothetical protein ASE45_06370 [Lysobacter sp. Root96]|nr:hypothetical protein ASE45_06370 [Lysobacter sp. Root96]